MNRTAEWGPDILNQNIQKEETLEEFVERDQQYYRTPKVGDYLVPDGWGTGNNLEPGDAPVDRGYIGSKFRIQALHTDINLPVNITVTGKIYMRGCFLRCKIEFVGDCEPSVFVGGKILIR